MTRPLVVLVGPPGVGKTTVGQRLARSLHVTLRDTDQDIEADAGSSVADLFVTEGEAHFRRLERAAVAAALSEHDGVLALGGGAVTDPATREQLTAQRVAFLDVGLADAMRRLGMNRSRPLLLGNVRQQWLGLMQERRPLYLEVADITVATDGRDPDDVASEVEAFVRHDDGRPGRRAG
jgi:shikimate kinase